MWPMILQLKKTECLAHVIQKKILSHHDCSIHNDDKPLYSAMGAYLDPDNSQTRPSISPSLIYGETASPFSVLGIAVCSFFWWLTRNCVGYVSADPKGAVLSTVSSLSSHPKCREHVYRDIWVSVDLTQIDVPSPSITHIVDSSFTSHSLNGWRALVSFCFQPGWGSLGTRVSADNLNAKKVSGVHQHTSFSSDLPSCLHSYSPEGTT